MIENKVNNALYVKKYTQCAKKRVEIFLTAATIRRDIDVDVQEIFARQLPRVSA